MTCLGVIGAWVREGARGKIVCHVRIMDKYLISSIVTEDISEQISKTIHELWQRG
jgi:hypothetical protein